MATRHDANDANLSRIADDIIGLREAIERMDQGIYGLCEECNEPIKLERLKANPAARTCVEHAEEE